MMSTVFWGFPVNFSCPVFMTGRKQHIYAELLQITLSRRNGTLNSPCIHDKIILQKKEADTCGLLRERRWSP